MLTPLNDNAEKDKVCFEQNCEHFRALNQIMWQVPVIAMTLTGGLWFGTSHVDLPEFRYLLLLLAAFGNGGLIIVLHRMRFLIKKHLEKMKEFHPAGFVDAEDGGRFEGSRVVVRTFKILLFLSCAMSVVGIFLLAHSSGVQVSDATL